MPHEPLHVIEEEEEEEFPYYNYAEFAARVRSAFTKYTEDGSFPPDALQALYEMKDYAVVDQYIKSNPKAKELLYEPSLAEVIPFGMGEYITGEESPGWTEFYEGQLKSIPGFIASNVDFFTDENWEEIHNETLKRLKKLDADPKIRAYREWANQGLSSEEFWSASGIKRLMDTVDSGLHSLTAILGGGAIGAVAGAPAGPAGIGYGFIAGSVLSTYALEGSGGYTESIRELTQDKHIDIEEYLRKRDAFKKLVTSKTSNQGKIDEAMGVWEDNNYYEKDGKKFERGLSPTEASQVSLLSNVMVGVQNAAIEYITLGAFGKLFRVAGFTGPASKTAFNASVYGKTLKNVSEKLRDMPTPKKGGVLNRTWDWAERQGKVANIGILALTEGMQEIAQEYSAAAHKTIGPAAWSDTRLGDAFTQAHAMKSFIAGFGTGVTVGGTGVMVGNAIDEIKNIRAPLKKSGVRYYHAYNKNTEMYEVWENNNGVNRKLEDNEMVDGKNQNKANFKKRGQAKRAVINLQKKHSEFEQLKLIDTFGRFSDKAKIKIEFDEGSGFFMINAYDGDKLLFNVGITETKNEAIGVRNNITSKLTWVEKLKKKLGVTNEDIDDNTEYQDALNEDLKRTGDRTRGEAKAVLMSYMGMPLREKDQQYLDSALATLGKDNKDLQNTPDLIPNILLNENIGPGILLEAGISHDDLITAYNENYQEEYPTAQ